MCQGWNLSAKSDCPSTVEKWDPMPSGSEVLSAYGYGASWYPDGGRPGLFSKNLPGFGVWGFEFGVCALVFSILELRSIKEKRKTKKVRCVMVSCWRAPGPVF